MQVWRDVIVKKALLQDEESTPYLQRKHHVVKNTGYNATVHAAAGASRVLPASVLEKLRQARENA